MVLSRIAIEIPRALKEEFKLYCKEQHISFNQKIIELLEEDLKNKKGCLGPQYHPSLKTGSDSIRPKAVKEDQRLDNFLMRS
jgi:NAD+--asparagine ADP-ribosyltransferase